MEFDVVEKSDRDRSMPGHHPRKPRLVTARRRQLC
jgi:hypothetical protein